MQTLHISDDIRKLKLQVKRKEKAVKMMGEEFVECFRLAEKMNGVSFTIKGNGLKGKSDKTKDDNASLEEAIVELQNKIMKLNELNQFFHIFT